MDSLDTISAKVHRAGLSLRPPISQSTVEDFETAVGVQIPQDYRDFLLRVADGGLAPCRLLPLSQWSNSYWIVDPKPSMAAELPVVTPEAYEQGVHWLDKTNVIDWEGRWDRNEWDPMFGTIAVAEIGCGLYFSMVMTGPLRGRIFSWGDAALNPPYFCPETSFSLWFESCLDMILAGRPVHFLDGRI
jgi:hypothetical protein